MSRRRPGRGVRAAVVVVPAHDEEQLLPHCLDALDVAVSPAMLAAAAPQLEHVHVLVVLDACTDGTLAVVAGRRGTSSVAVHVRSVGAARSAGFAAAVAYAGVPPDRLWLATTDADSAVPPRWLARQLELADVGHDAVLGTVTVADWREHADHVPPAWAAGYDQADGHGHVHGASLGVRASAYLAAGGFPAVTVGEDAALVERLRHTAASIVATASVPVRTSARVVARAPDGFAAFLRHLDPVTPLRAVAGEA